MSALALAVSRAWGQCEACSRHDPGTRPWSRTGERNPQRASAVLLLCPGHVDDARRHPDQAARLGWAVPPGVDPARVPARLDPHGWALLDDAGGVTATRPPATVPQLRAVV